MLRPIVPVIVSRPDVGSAASLLFFATLIIVVDVRLPSLDVVPDAIGGLMVLVGVMRVHGAIRGADGLRTALVVLAVIALPVTMLETVAPIAGEIALLGLSQLIGTIVLARLLAEAFRDTEPALAALWRMAYQLAIWLALVPFVVGVVLGRLSGGGQFESPLAIVLIVILAVPLIVVLQALWRTREIPVADGVSPA
jgi:hypothetical protein